MEEIPFWEKEEPNYWWIAAVVVLVIALLIARGRVIAKRKQQINAYIFENISTEEHAWKNIIIGETIEETVEDQVFDLDYVQKSSIETVTVDQYTYTDWSWNPSPDNVKSYVRSINGFVDRIILSFPDELTVASIIAVFGYPDEVYVSEVMTEPDDRFWTVTLHYLEEGINVVSYSRRLKKSFSQSDTVMSIELFKPDDISTAQELALVYGIDIRDILEILPAWLPTKDKQLFESYLTLFRHTDPIAYGPDGVFETTGLELGLFIADNEVRILRDGTTYDNTGTLIECPTKSYGCSFRSSLDPNQNKHIFINGLQAASIRFHAGTIAHEAFHLTTPFQSLQNSMYEELTGITIGYEVSDGENRDIYMIAPPSNVTASQADMVEYFTLYCGETCSYLELPAYPDTWENLPKVNREEEK
ncbi:MAG: hypothetical protein V2J07_05505 [Anaerolineae bacterium]|nr:hypothetical protein [Anaerolineae bacterium]